MSNINIEVSLEERRRRADAKYAELMDTSCCSAEYVREWNELVIEYKFLAKMARRYLSVEMNEFFKRKH